VGRKTVSVLAASCAFALSDAAARYGLAWLGLLALRRVQGDLRAGGEAMMGWLASMLCSACTAWKSCRRHGKSKKL